MCVRTGMHLRMYVCTHLYTYTVCDTSYSMSICICMHVSRYISQCTYVCMYIMHKNLNRSAFNMLDLEKTNDTGCL